jgi:hypothetical protein
MDPAFAFFGAGGLAGVDDLSVSVGVETRLSARDLADESFSDAEGEVRVFDIDIMYHCVGAGLLVANPSQDAFGVCCQASHREGSASCH